MDTWNAIRKQNGEHFYGIKMKIAFDYGRTMLGFSCKDGMNISVFVQMKIPHNDQSASQL